MNKPLTAFTLEVRNVKTQDKYDKLCKAIKEFDLYKYVFDESSYFEVSKGAYFSSYEPQMWNSCTGQMIILSEKFPEMTFELTCEQMGNFCREYYKDGNWEQCFGEVIFEKPRTIKWEELAPF